MLNSLLVILFAIFTFVSPAHAQESVQTKMTLEIHWPQEAGENVRVVIFPEGGNCVSELEGTADESVLYPGISWYGNNVKTATINVVDVFTVCTYQRAEKLWVYVPLSIQLDIPACAEFDYTPVIPADGNASSPTVAQPVPQKKAAADKNHWSLGSRWAGSLGNSPAVNVSLHGGWAWNDHLTLLAAAGVDLVYIPSEAFSPQPHLALGVGYGNEYSLPRPVVLLPDTLGWKVAAVGGLGSFQAKCGPAEFDPMAAGSANVTCGHQGEFPLQVMAPWFGPEASTRILWSTTTKGGRTFRSGFDFSLTGEVYAVSNTWLRPATVHSTAGDQRVAFEFEEDTMVWVVPRFGAGIVFQW